MRSCCAFATFFLLGVLSGCSDGEKRARLSGEAVFDGQPIPFGEVTFTPDGGKKNDGPQGFANIRDGRYDTATAPGKGIGGGAMIIRVTGFASEGGKLLCEYEYKAELPKEGGEFKIEVPKTGGAGDRKSKQI